jgi:hypothetical protein
MAFAEPSRLGKSHHSTMADKPALEAITISIHERLSNALKSSEKSLDEHRAIGEALLKAKPLVRRGYLHWAKERFGFSKQWCARLTKLAESWDQCLQARSWAEEQGYTANNRYAVDGALALVRRWQDAQAPALEAATARPKRQKASEIKAELDTVHAELDVARVQIQETDAKLAGALAEISDLQARLSAVLGDRQNAYASEPRGPVDWTSANHDMQSGDVMMDPVDASSASEEESSASEEETVAVTVSLGQSQYDALVLDAAANSLTLEATLLAKIRNGASDQGIEPPRRDATGLERLLNKLGETYVDEKRLRTLGPNERYDSSW